MDATRTDPFKKRFGSYTVLTAGCQAADQRVGRSFMDVMGPEARSRNMAAICGADTKPEMIVRRSLHARGFRFRLHVKGLPGRPDLVLRRRRAVIFVHGCFWHRHPGCRYASTPATRPEFWQGKFAANVVRDARARNALVAAGWRVATVWECQLRRPIAEATLDALADWLQGDGADFERAFRHENHPAARSSQG